MVGCLACVHLGFKALQAEASASSWENAVLHSSGPVPQGMDLFLLPKPFFQQTTQLELWILTFRGNLEHRGAICPSHDKTAK